MNLCIIPAKHRSTRLPNKNYMLFNGVSMVDRAKGLAENSRIFDEIIISDEDNRNGLLCDDDAGLIEVIQYHVSGHEFEIVCCLLPCTPLLTVDILQGAYTKFISSKANALIPVVPYSGHYFRALRERDGKLSMLNPDMYSMHSQDLPVVYKDADCFWFLRVSAIMKEKTLYPVNSIPYMMKEMDCQGVDTFEDLDLLEAKYGWKNRNNR